MKLKLKLFIQGFFVSGSMRAAIVNAGLVGNTNDCDLIVVKLFSPGNYSTPVFTLAGMLKTDGTVEINVPDAAVGNSFFICVNHRNTVETWSSSAVAMDAETTYDFSVAKENAYGSNQVEVETDVFAFYSGDINQDGVIESADYSLIENANLLSTAGYVPENITGETTVTQAGYDMLEANLNLVISRHFPV